MQVEEGDEVLWSSLWLAWQVVPDHDGGSTAKAASCGVATTPACRPCLLLESLLIW